jgi:hypothetical protein
MKRLVSICVVVMSLAACSQLVDLHQESKVEINYSDLPKPVQVAFDAAFERGRRDGSEFLSGLVHPEFINLDLTIAGFSKNVAGKAGVKPGSRCFRLGGIDFILAWNANRENPPFIHYQGKIYYTIEKKLNSQAGINAAKCESADIQKYLK